jgi:hypothetical protein
MPNQTRQQVADQLNKLTSQGASEQKILDYVATAGYKPDDFNADLNGSFRPMVVGTGTISTNYTETEARESQQYYENLTASSSTVTPKPSASITTAPTTTKTVTTTEVTNFQQTTGGGTSTVFSTPAVSTSASQEYKAQADQAYNLQQAYASNPNSTFGQKTLDRKLADGTITPAQYNEIKNLSPEDRRAKSLEYNAQYETARTNEIATQAGGQPSVVTTPSQNNSSITVDYQKTTSTSSTTLNGAVGGTNVTTETVEGVTYQVVNNADGTKTYTTADAPDLATARQNSVTVDDGNPTPKENINPNTDPNTNIGAEGQDVTGFEPLQEPPITTDGDEFSGIDEQVQRQKDLEDGSLEFAGIDEQIADNENALQEPPLLSDEEIDQQLRLAAQDETVAEQKVPDEFDGIDEQVAANKEQADAEAAAAAAEAGNSQGLSTTLQDTRSQATQQDVSNFQAKPDWRVRLSLAPGATYLYKTQAPGILAPLAATDGVIFPYTPAISVQYAASYDATELTHSNYKFFTYRGSAVDTVSISCDFTAQDTFEANYLLAVIHFFRSVTKMFYGQDQNPKIGTPPPLCYLSGLGAFQFDAHPLAITAFTYTLPTDCDYIRAGSTPTPAGVSRAPSNVPLNSASVSGNRLATQGLQSGGSTAPPQFNPNSGTRDVTYVPTKMSISISAVPIVTRKDISNKYSLKE